MKENQPFICHLGLAVCFYPTCQRLSKGSWVCQEGLELCLPIYLLFHRQLNGLSPEGVSILTGVRPSYEALKCMLISEPIFGSHIDSR